MDDNLKNQKFMNRIKSEKETQVFNYEIVYSKRHSIGISISPDSEIIVRAPLLTSRKVIDNIIQKKTAWINKHLESYASLIRFNRNSEYVNGEVHYYQGKENFLSIINSQKSYVSHYENIIEIGLDRPDDPIRVKMCLDTWYRKEAQEVLSSKLNDILLRYKEYCFPVKEFSVRLMKGRWGSCNSKGKITVSSELIKMDEIFFEYVILHELCHLKHHNHGQNYYRLLSEVFPEWKSVRKEMKRYVR